MIVLMLCRRTQLKPTNSPIEPIEFETNSNTNPNQTTKSISKPQQGQQKRGAEHRSQEGREEAGPDQAGMPEHGEEDHRLPAAAAQRPSEQQQLRRAQPEHDERDEQLVRELAELEHRGPADGHAAREETEEGARGAAAPDTAGARRPLRQRLDSGVSDDSHLILI